MDSLKFPTTLPGMLYEPLLRDNLVRLATLYGKSVGLGLSTIGRRLANDSRFFERITTGGRTFTALQYDRIVSRLSEDWPRDVEWPEAVPRPTKRQRKKAMDREPHRKTQQEAN